MSPKQSFLREDNGIFPLSELAKRGAIEFGENVSMRARNNDGYQEITYLQLYTNITNAAQWLIKYGINKNDHVAVLSENRPQWGMVYLAIQTAGAIAIPVDSMMPVSGIRHILADSKARVLFASNKFINILSEIEPIPTLEKIVCFEDNKNDDLVSWDEVQSKGSILNAELPERSLEELAVIIYTSGTTGYSKGVMLTQRNIISNVAAVSRLFEFGVGDNFLSILPLHHSFECTAGFLFPLYCGCSITYAQSMKSADIIADIRNTNVTMMLGVPLLFEKMHESIIRGIKKKGKTTKTLFSALFNISAGGEKVGLELGKKLFASMREKAGLKSIKMFVSGGGPLDPRTASFFNRLGITMLQGYGLTETSPVTHVNLPWRPRNETVGPPLPGVECCLKGVNSHGVGEVCIKGENVFKGYFNNPIATEEVFDEEGWFHTGDLGIIHSDGYLQIMGRKKNVIVTGGGKNVYPEEIEYHLSQSIFISESLVYGLPRGSGYGEEVAALILPDYEQVDLHFEQSGTKATTEDVHKLIKEEIRHIQGNLAEYKHIKTFRLVDEEFQKTSTRKIKRFLYRGEMLKTNGV